MGVQQDIREKGLLATVAGIGDDVFTRVTAGISVGEFRRMLQGEAPGRPNPRLKPHSEAFLLHIKPTYYHESVTRWNHTFRLGLLSTWLFLIETITGLLLMVWYAPSPERAYTDMILLLTNVPFGQFLRDLHRLGAEMMVAIVTLHMVRTYLTGSYKAPRQFTWFTGVILFVVTLFLSFSGYLLPWDQLALWAVTIGTSMAEAMPPAIVGETVNLLARGAPDIGANGLLRFYLLHVIFLPLILILFFFVHYYKVVHFGISLPADEEEVGEDTASRIPAEKRTYYLPDVAIDELSFLTVFTMVTIFLTMFYFQAPLEHIANPQSTPLHTVAPWYFYWLQGLLKVADKFIAGVLLPGVLLVLLIAIPYLDMNPSRRGKDRRVAIVSGIVAGVVMIILSWMGTPYYAVQGAPAIEIIQELMPEEGSGLLREEVGYKHLPLGVFSTDDHDAVYEDEEFAHVMHEYTAAVEMFDEEKDDFNGARGQLTITQEQPGLKRIFWEIFWFDAKSNEAEYKRAFWLHEDSIYWEQYGFKPVFVGYLTSMFSAKE
ncbi:MAG: cytochrome bc complex cytochrome b subunit [Chloroflexi bacterium]|nr:MAG: cytochrome bc complex cytochrome b subunit [Chloroflexota bacterium]